MKHVNAALRGLAWAFSVASILFVGAVWALVRYPDADNTAAYVDSIVVKFLNASGNAQAVSSSNPLPAAPPAWTYTNISTATNTVIKAAPGTFAGIIIDTGGVGSAATVYDNTTCTGTTIGVFSTATQNPVLLGAGAAALTGICVATAGGAAANITILWR